MSQQRADQLVEAGLWLKLSGDTEGARRLFEQALRMDPDNARAKQLLESRPPAPPPSAGPPGMSAPPTNAPPPGSVGSAGLLEQDWAMATGIIAERQRGQTPPPVPLNAGASVPDAAPPPPDLAQDAKPWAPEAALKAATLVWGTPAPTGAAPERLSGATLVWGAVAPQVPPPAPVAVPPAPLAVPPGLQARSVDSAWDQQPTEDVKLAAGMGRALDLVSTPVPSFTPPPGSSARRTRDEVKTLLKGARDLLELDDHTGAIDLILKAQELAPADPDVAKMRERSEQILQTMFESKLGAMDRRPRVVLRDDEIIWLNLDHRAGFVLAQIDGSVSFEDLFAVSGMTRLDTARILAQLMDEGIIKA